ncbi:MAG: DUF3108 domain-containing protein [Gemmatimonadetes bacterium]|nr:DUF3108 domain-containing protein [Gemmatimonadota bacterium]
MRAFAALSLLPTLAAAQSQFDAARLVPRSDSFAVTVQGRQVGGIRETIEKTATGYRLVSVQSLAGMNQSTEVHFSRALAMTSVKQEGQARGQSMKIDVAYGRGRAKGTATTPGAQGMKTIAVDTTVPAGAVDDNVLQSLLPALPLGAGKTFQVPVFASGQGTSKVMTVTVSGSESVTVPAGTFEAWKVDVAGGQVPVTFWVSRTDPRVVKMGFAGAPMAFELVK